MIHDTPNGIYRTVTEAELEAIVQEAKKRGTKAGRDEYEEELFSEKPFGYIECDKCRHKIYIY